MKEREQEENKEIAHERERNWNSPRPDWSTHKSPPTSHLKIRNKSSNSFRATSSLTCLGDSDGYRDTSRVPTKVPTALPKVDASSATSLAFLHKSGFDENPVGSTHSAPSNGFSPTPGAASKFGWNFARSPLPPLELDGPADRRRSTGSLTSGSRPSSRTSGAIESSQIPARSRMKSFSSVGHATSDMSLTHVVGDESSLRQDYQNGLTEVVEPRSRGEPPAVRNSWSQEDMVLGVPLSSSTTWMGNNTAFRQ